MLNFSFHVILKQFHKAPVLTNYFLGKIFFFVSTGQDAVCLTQSGAQAISSVGVKHATVNLHNYFLAITCAVPLKRDTCCGSLSCHAWQLHASALINRSQISEGGMLLYVCFMNLSIVVNIMALSHSKENLLCGFPV